MTFESLMRLMRCWIMMVMDDDGNETKEDGLIMAMRDHFYAL